VRTATTRVEDIPKTTLKEWLALGREVDEALLATLRGLSEDEWNAVTDCDPWTVKDSIAHLVGWAEAVASPIELTRQTAAGYRVRKDHGNLLDSHNHMQVEKMRHLSPAQMIDRFQAIAPRFNKTRLALGAVGKAIPMKEPFSGTWIRVEMLMGGIFTRDHFMHWLDIHRAIGRPPAVGRTHSRIVEGLVKEWAGKTDADVTLELTGPGGGTFIHGSGATHIHADAMDFARVLAGRPVEDFAIEGDSAAARRWLQTRAVF
jgi:uncharacterized protein (TIGR03083 family)